jgi:hypothetical protein
VRWFALMGAIVVVASLLGACGKGKGRDSHATGASSSYRFIGQPVVAGLGNGDRPQGGNDVVEVIFQTNRRLSGSTRGIVAVNGVPNSTVIPEGSHTTLFGYGPDPTCYKAHIILYGPRSAQAALIDARPGDRVTVTLATPAGQAPLDASVLGHPALRRPALYRLAADARCPRPRVADTHPRVRIGSLGVSEIAHLNCYGDDTDIVRGGLPCELRPRLPRLSIQKGGRIQVLGSRQRPKIVLLSPFEGQPRQQLTARLVPHRVAGTKRKWEARIPRQLDAKTDGVEVALTLPHHFFAYYQLSVDLIPG